MCIVPFITEGANRTIVESKDAFDKAGGFGGNVLYFQNLDSSQLKSKDTNVSYDLRVGTKYRHHRDSRPEDLMEDGFIRLTPGSAVIIQTVEEVHFPKSCFGLILPKVSLLQKGVSNTSSKVDPGYQGHLQITVFNLGKQTVRLRRGEAFCCVNIIRTLEGATLYEKGSKQILGTQRTQILAKLFDLLERNQALLTAFVLLCNIILALVTASLLLKK